MTIQSTIDWQSRTATLLDDPIILDWALDYYRDLSVGNPLRKELASTWFHDINLRRWLGEGGGDAVDMETIETHSHLIRCLPAAAFTNFASTLINRWNNWTGDTAGPITRLVATLDPDRAAQIFSTYLRQSPPATSGRTWSIAENLDKLPVEAACSLFEQLLPFTFNNRDVENSLLHQALFSAAVHLNRLEELPRLFDGFLSNAGRRQQSDAELVARKLFGHVSYVRLFFWRRAVDQAPSFAKLASLFHNEAPLAEMDAVVEAEAPLPMALALLETCRVRLPASALAWEIIQRSARIKNPNAAVVLAGLALAAVAAAFELSSMDVSTISPEDAFTLLTMNIDTNIHYAALLESVTDSPKPDVTALAIRHLKNSRDENGGIAVARLMGDLGWREFVSPLIACIDEGSGDFLCESAAEALLKIGEPARDTLIAKWDELDSTQQIYGGSVIIRMGGTPVADFVLARSDTLMQEGAEQWCRFALAAPDERVADLIRTKLPLDHPLINEAAYCLLRLFGSNDPEVPGLREKIMRRRAHQQNRRNALLGGGDSPDKPELELRCCTCNAVNLYEVDKVMIAPEHGGKPYLIADEFPCKVCGKFTEFELEANAKMVLMGETLRVVADNAADKKPVSPRIASINVMTSDGTVQSINAAYYQLQENVRKNPRDWLSWHRLSNINVSINRPNAALLCSRQAYSLNPLLLEIIYNAAARLQDAGHAHQALDLLSSALQRIDEWTSQSIYIEKEGIDFADLYNDLRQETGRTHLSAMHPKFIVGHTNLVPRKLGRNDPCACGSGKKYKKCCMP